MHELEMILVPALTFGAVAAVIFAAGHYFAAHNRVQRRLTTTAADLPGDATFAPLQRFVIKYFEEGRFGVNDAQREKLRRDLLKAGYFSPHAVNYYIGARIGSVLLVPTLLYLAFALAPVRIAPAVEIVLISVTTMLAIA